MREDVRLEVVDPASAPARAALAGYLAELADRFGFDNTAGDSDAPDLVAPAGCFVVALADGVAVGCGGLRTIADGIGEVKRMWVDPDWRGQGIAGALLRRLEDESRARGHHAIRLDTNAELHEALAMYRRAGYVEVAAYNDNPYAHHWFEKPLTDAD